MEPRSERDARVGRAEHVRDVFDAMPVVLLGLSGPDHRVTAANTAARLGLRHERLVGRTAVEVLGPALADAADRVYATGTTQVLPGWRLPAELVSLDLTLVARRDPSGSVVGLDLTGEVVESGAHREVGPILQGHLLPPGLPVLPTTEVAGIQLLADAGDGAGGDWFDALRVPDGRLALVVGDVVGRGVAASAAMAQLRAVMQDRLDETGDVLAAVRAVDRLAGRVGDARAATVCVALLDPRDGTLTYCSAGHPPPLVVGPGGSRYLALPESGPLGTGAARTVAVDALGPDELVVLYTDGILQRPGCDLATASVQLAQVAAGVLAERQERDPTRSAVDHVCTVVLDLLLRETGHRDDVTLLAAGRRAPPQALRLELGTVTESIITARRSLHGWLRGQGVGEPEALRLCHAVGELVTNSVEHSSPDRTDGRVTLTADLTPAGDALLTVADDGRWRRRNRPGGPAPHHHGLGLAMTTGFVDSLTVEHDERGTTALARHRLTRPARLLVPADLTPAGGPDEPDPPELMLVMDQPWAPTSRIAVHGPVDAGNAEHLAHELDRRTLGGTHPLTVDLTGVTLLSSGAVATLLRLVGSLRLYAPPGSAADQVLTLVGLAHETRDPDGGTTGE
jgi:anti-sigma regulatory factor (Ser/Thr protein kinase)